MLYREAGQFKTRYEADMAVFPIRQDRIGMLVLLAIAFVGVPLLAALKIWPFGSEYLLRAILLPFLILSLAAIGVNILIGYCGQISLGSGAFMAIGAYMSYKFGTGMPEIGLPALPVLLAILLGGLCSAIVGILVSHAPEWTKRVLAQGSLDFMDVLSYHVYWSPADTESAEPGRPTLMERDVRQFHDQVLGQGAVSLDLLEKRIKAWVVEKRAAK